MMPDRADADWNLVFASVAGTSHSDGLCQDHADGRIITAPDGPVLVAAVADGAGSASHSDQGAKAAVDAFLAEAEAGIAATTSEAIPVEQVRSWVDAARRRVESEAEIQGVPLRQFACTLLVAVVGPTSAMFAQVGDGVIVFDGLETDGYVFAFWPDMGEYANTTRFLTDADYKSRLHVDRLDRPIQALSILTDGLQMLALDYAASQVHARFFAPLFSVVEGSTDQETLRAGLLAFLDSPRINARTDDDKTLLLATRRMTTRANSDERDAHDRPDETA